MKRRKPVLKNKDLQKEVDLADKEIRSLERKISKMEKDKKVRLKTISDLRLKDSIKNISSYIGKYYRNANSNVDGEYFDDSSDYIYVSNVYVEHNYVRLLQVIVEERDGNTNPHFELILTYVTLDDLPSTMRDYEQCSKQVFQKALLKTQRCLDDVFNSRNVLTEKKL